jgi:polyphosphate kinase
MTTRKTFKQRPEGTNQNTALVNRDLSWLAFNRRVLHEAQDVRNPLLERVKFWMIHQSNLDEFYMKRVGALLKQVQVGRRGRGQSLFPGELLELVRTEILSQTKIHARIYRQEFLPQLKEQGIEICRWQDLTKAEKKRSTEIFKAKVFPILTPLAVDPGHPFPFLSNLSTSLGVVLKSPVAQDADERLFARIKVPKNIPQWLKLSESDGGRRFRFLSLIDLISQHVDSLFPNMEILEVMPFRVTRSADLERDESDTEDLREMVEEELHQRRFAKVIRLETGPRPSAWILEFLQRELELTDQDVYSLPGELDVSGFGVIYDLPFAELKFEPFQGVCPARLLDDSVSIFSVIRAGDLLVHHPYESFASSVERFVREAAEDPKVIAIKMTLYRTNEGSPILHSLLKAAELGKHVVCLVELKARFDEERNILWAERLEKAGVHVVYGIVGLKTHTKLALVVRMENEGLRSYCHIGTGNYNSTTSKLYTDVGLFTSEPEILADVIELFNYLTGRSLRRDYRRLLVAPINMKDRFLRMIEREKENAQLGRPARIIAKMNSLEDSALVEALYLASQKGVEIDLIVRGFCCLRPGVAGQSENIRVISVIGRYLEHSRIFYFQNGAEEPADGEVYLGSADWMYRNLNSRVEVITPVLDRSLRERCFSLLTHLLEDRRQSWVMNQDGTYFQRKRPGEEHRMDILPGIQQELMKAAHQGNPDRVGIKS